MEVLPKFVAAFIGDSNILSKLATVIYPFCFKRKTLELLVYLSFKVELSTGDHQKISCFGIKICSDVKKFCEAIRPPLVI